MYRPLPSRSTDSKNSQAPKGPAPMMQQPYFFNQMQHRYGNRLSGMIMNESAREAVSAGFGQDSVDIYDMWKLRKEPEKLHQFMQDRMYRMDGGLQ